MSGEWDDWIGRSETRRDVATAGLIARLRATLNSDDAGDVAPQGIHWCLCLPDAPTGSLGDDGHPRRDMDGAFLPPVPLPRRMWASSTVDFLSPIHVGSTITRHTTITGIGSKHGTSGALTFVTLAHRVMADGAPAVHEEQVLVYRQAASVAREADPLRTGAARADTDRWPHTRTLVPTEPLLMRYSAMTFNAHRIHYDLPYAQATEGYRGLVVHGPLTATLLLDHAARLVGDNRVKNFSFRGLSPLICGEAMTLAARDESGGAMTLAALGPDGVAAMEGEARY